MQSLRIVSLLPSATEIVCALGLESSLVGRSHECDFPHGVERLPVCTSPKVGGRDTREIHMSVSAILQHDISVYSVDGALLRELAPTHVITQVQCEVCAVSLKDVEAAIADWSGIAAPKIVALNPQSLDDVFDDMRHVGRALSVDAEPLITSMKSRMRPRIATIEWLEPLMTAGNWMPTLIDLAGAIDVLGKPGEHSPWITWDDLASADPDIIVVLPCGFTIDQTKRDWHYLASNPMWSSLRAVRNRKVFITDGNQYFNRPGPRLVESLEILREIIRGDRDAGIGWQRCDD